MKISRSELDINAETAALKNLLVAGAAEMRLALTDSQVQLLLSYIIEFDKWNKAYNLSAVRDIEQMITRHLLDSLSVAPWINSNNIVKLDNIIDVGTGGGLPGIPLAIMFPQKRFTLLDSNGKKTRFLFHIKTLLGLTNVRIENRRVNEFQPNEKYQGIISRAFASLLDMTLSCAHLLSNDGVFMAMKGQFPADEMEAINNQYRLIETQKLLVTATEGERHLLILQPCTFNQATNV